MKLMVTLALMQASEASAYLAPMAKLKRNKHDLTIQIPKKKCQMHRSPEAYLFPAEPPVARVMPVSRAEEFFR